jgi:NAD+ synthase
MAAGPLAGLVAFDASAEIDRIAGFMRREVEQTLKRRGTVTGVSGGIDSSVVVALAARALGPERTVALLMPERESSPESLELGRTLAERLGVRAIVEDITPILEACGCYRRRDEMIRTVVPAYGPGFRSKIVLPDLEGGAYRVFRLVVQTPDGEEIRARLTPEAYLGIVAATNFKQRVRKMLEYYHADRLGYAVTGTPNRLEYDQGFFVKNGDGAADIKPIAHLYKTQVYRLAEALQLPDTVRARPPTTDTYSLAQSQEEFYFSLPYDKMDACLYGRNTGLAPEVVAEAAGLSVDQVRHAYADIDGKRRSTRYQHLPPSVVAPIPEIGAIIEAARK